MKTIGDTIQVKTRRNRPWLVRWGRRLYSVRYVVEFWVLQTNWWTTNEVRRVYFSIVTDNGMMEIYRSGDVWVLTKLMD